MRIPNYDYIGEIENLEVRHEVMRQLAKTDLWFLCRHVLGYADLETRTDIHLRLCRELEENPLRYLLLIPRNFFKTSISLGRCIQVLLNDPSAQIGIGSDHIERAERQTRDMRDVIEGTPLLHTLFPDVFHENPRTESSLWKAREFNIKRPERHTMTGGFRLPSVSAFGLDPMPTGAHYTFVYLDDIENDTNSENQEQIDKLNRHLSAFFPILNPSTPVLLSGTIWAENGPNTRYQNSPGWQLYKRRVRTGDGNPPNKPTFPSRWDEAALEQMEADIRDPHYWAGQYLLTYLKPTDNLLFPFRKTHFHYYQYNAALEGAEIQRDNQVISLEDTLVFITVDPSGGADEEQATAKTDKVGWAVNAVSLDARWHVLDMNAAYLDDDAFIDKLFELYDLWDPITIGIEEMPHLTKVLSMAFKERKRSLPISKLTPKRRKKSDRIRALSPILNTIFFRYASGHEKYLQGYYTSMEHGDDTVDALAYQIDIARAPTQAELDRRRKEAEKARQERLLLDMPPLERQEWEHTLAFIQQKQYGEASVQDSWRKIYGVHQ